VSGFPDYDRYDAIGLADLVRSRDVTATELLEEAIARAEALNPSLNAIIHPMYEEGRRDAALPAAGPFGGVPFLLKDILHAYAGVPLTAGSAALRKYLPDRDSEVVARFRRAGLVVFGKTNVPEFGLVATTEPKAFGPTHNPWDVTRSTGGSSGGSAAAVAAGIVPMASATDGGGSIRIPAAWCGLFGLKPSRGRIFGGPEFGEIWEGAVVDNVVSRSVRDSAAALDVLTGPAPGDPYLVAMPERPFSEEVGIPPGRLRIAYSTRSPIGGPVDEECRRAVESTLPLLEELGHDLVEVEPAIDGMAVARAYLTLYFGHVAADLRLIAHSFGPDAVKTGIEPTTRVVGLIGETISGADFVESKRGWNRFAREMGAFHQSHDLYLTPTTAAPPVELGALDPSPLEEFGLRIVNSLRAGGALRASGLPERLALENLSPVPFTQLANLTGQPAMSVPLHWPADGLPYGVHFTAALGGEARLIRLAAQLEEARPWWDRRPVRSA
jgi:amidase